jgi:hypothetical protein
MIASSPGLPRFYMGKATFWLSGYQIWLSNWVAPPFFHSRLSSPQDQFIYISSPCLPANSEIAASFSFERVRHARLGPAMPRCDWRRALDLGLQASLVDEDRHISRLMRFLRLKRIRFIASADEEGGMVDLMH